MRARSLLKFSRKLLILMTLACDDHELELIEPGKPFFVTRARKKDE